MTSLVFAFKVDVHLVGLEKIVKLNVKKGNGVRNAKMIVAIVLMEHLVIELVSILEHVIVQHEPPPIVSIIQYY